MLGNLRRNAVQAARVKSAFNPFAGLAVVALVGLVQPLPAQAQAVEAALAEARARVACGAGTPVSAVYLPSGAIQVTCRQNLPEQTATNSATAEAATQSPVQPQATAPSTLTGTGLATAPALATVMATVVLSIVVGDGGSSTTTAVDAPIEPQ